ncbi:MAG TPA: hypothetical protein VFD06_14545 [Candidatus Polarisedimenticolia bacterium]|nr:hypothetical protein [Candidatus Polarisedimenticolia bacterium]
MNKTMLMFGAAAFLVSAMLATPAHAQAVKEKSCTDEASGVSWDCDYKLKSVTPGTPVSFTVNYSCNGACGPVLSFGLQSEAFSPAGCSGHLVGGRRLPGALELTFAFDSVKVAGVSGNALANAHFMMNVMATDASGAPVIVSLPVDVRLNEFENKK